MFLIYACTTWRMRKAGRQAEGSAGSAGLISVFDFQLACLL